MVAERTLTSAAAYCDYVRAVLRSAGLAWCGRERAITNAVIDYATEVDGCPLHDGLGWDGGRGYWADPASLSVGSCSRFNSTPLLGAVPGGLGRRRELSLVSLDRPNRRPPDGREGFYDQVTASLLELPERHDHLYGWLPVLFAFCPNRAVAYFSQYSPGPEIHRLAALHGVEMVHLPLEEIPEMERERHRWVDG